MDRSGGPNPWWLMRFIFIDRVLSLTANREVVALRNVALSDEVFRDHFAGCPVMPASLLIESLHQAATVLLEVSTRFSRKALPVMVDRAKFRALVQPGDQLRITVTLLSLEGESARMDGTIHVGDRLVASAGLTFALQDSGAFYPPHARGWVKSTYAYWLKEATLNGVSLPLP